MDSKTKEEAKDKLKVEIHEIEKKDLEKTNILKEKINSLQENDVKIKETKDEYDAMPWWQQFLLQDSIERLEELMEGI